MFRPLDKFIRRCKKCHNPISIRNKEYLVGPNNGRRHITCICYMNCIWVDMTSNTEILFVINGINEDNRP